MGLHFTESGSIPEIRSSGLWDIGDSVTGRPLAVAISRFPAVLASGDILEPGAPLRHRRNNECSSVVWLRHTWGNPGVLPLAVGGDLLQNIDRCVQVVASVLTVAWSLPDW